MSPRIPASTYRLQLHAGMNLKNALELVDYLKQLGITDVYTSPLSEAQPGSVHGYDIINHRHLNPEIGSEEQLAEFARRLDERGMEMVVDIVPNHMSIANSRNRWWQDVLENGPGSLHADFFDIDWNPPKGDLANKVLLPVLGDQYGKVLENGEISIISENGDFSACYGENRFPLAPRSFTWILEPALQVLTEKVGDSAPEVLELESIIKALEHLPPLTETDRTKIRERRRETQVIKRRIAALRRESAQGRAAIAASLGKLNGVKGDPASFDRLEGLLADQAYRLSFWKVASDEINYRRFFDVNDLAAIRVEEREVFTAVNELIFHFVGQGWVTGLRVDHVDGLLDPEQYLRRLQSGCASALTGRPPPRAARDGEETKRPFYVVVEKILGENETLRRDWAAHGTTGYDFLNIVGSLLVARENRARFHDLYRRFIGESLDFSDVVYESKKLVIRTAMAGEWAVLARRLDHISEQHRWSRDFTLNSLADALGEVIACFPVYRSYVRPQSGAVSKEDRQHIVAAITRAKMRNPTISSSIFDFIASVLLLKHPERITHAQRAERREFVLRFQQLTAPVMAKGFEDTALYRYYPLASLNEVGGDPDGFGVSVEEFHQWNQRMLQNWPGSLSATSTHDTKRSEDVRVRLSALSEIPDEWEKAIGRWYLMNRPARLKVDEREVPDANEEYLLYQTLVGTWPMTLDGETGREQYIGRIRAYMDKAVKEAKVHTSWMNVNEEHDQALSRFLDSILAAESPFIADLAAFQRPLARAGMLNSLTQVVLKIATPGVADFYQGNELWDLSLVDPDNRRPIDFASRRAMLVTIRENAGKNLRTFLHDLLKDMSSGAIKMYVTHRALEFRCANRELFATGAYVPLAVQGERESNAVAFARSLGTKQIIVVAGRFFMRLPEMPPLPVDPRAWGETRVGLAKGLDGVEYIDLFTGETVKPERAGDGRTLKLAQVFAEMPVAMLVRAD